MSFRRVPFQFRTTDPVERQRELERRFGLPSSRNMLVDFDNPLLRDTVPKETSSSPRLQHRVPIFVEGYDQPVHSSVDSMGGTPESKKPNVRVIPIEIEGSENRPPSTRHRTYSGPAGKATDDPFFQKGGAPQPPLKRPMMDSFKSSITKPAPEPRVHNIPIQVEGTDNVISPKLTKSPKKDSVKPNGCTVSKSKSKSPEKKNKKEPEEVKEQNVDAEKEENGVENSLKQIEKVLLEFKSFEAQVQEFSGTVKDKQYRYLDEMLTRCMLKLDDVDTMGNENVRLSRKSAVKKIQACIDLLESKANADNGVVNISEGEVKCSKIQETSQICEESNASQADVEMKDGQMELSENSLDIASEVSSQDVTNKCEVEPSVEIPSELPQDVTNKCEVEPSVEIPSELPQDVINNCEVEPSVEIPNEVPEVEMAEITEASSQVLNSNSNEVEMIDPSLSQPNVDSDDAFPIDEEIANSQINTISESDIEMKDVQGTLDGIKENVAEATPVNCAAVLDEKNCKSELNIIEKNIPSDNLDMPLPKDSVYNGDIKSCKNVPEDSDVKV